MKKIIIILVFLYLYMNLGAQWSLTFTDYGNFNIMFLNQSTGWTGGGGGRIYKTTNCGENWNEIYNPANQYNLSGFCFINENTGWLSNIQSTVSKTTNGGLNWITFPDVYNKKILDIFFINENTGWFVGTEGIYAKSVNGGVSWMYIGSTFFNSDANSIYFLDTQTGFVCGSGFFARTFNGGENWAIIPFVNINLSSVSFINSNTFVCAGNRYLGNASGLYVAKSTNMGLNWSMLSADTATELNHVSAKGLYFTSETTGYLALTNIHAGPTYTYYGSLKKTTNGGVNWTFFNGYFYDKMYDVTFLNQQTGFAVGSTYLGSGTIFKTTNGGVSYVNNISNLIPSSFSLFQNYPNPFNPTTIIRFQIKDSKTTTLKIFDLLGREVQTLVNEKLKPGEYEVTFDGSNFPSGVYFYKLQAGDFTDTKKLVLIK